MTAVMLPVIDACIDEVMMLLHLRDEDSVIMGLYRNPPYTLSQVSPAITSHHNVHCPTQVPRNENNRLMKRRCAYCRKMGKRSESNFYCDDCEGKPGLCLDCFKLYHNYI